MKKSAKKLWSILVKSETADELLSFERQFRNDSGNYEFDPVQIIGVMKVEHEDN